jgi:large subunit ribosomal protein L6
MSRIGNKPIDVPSGVEIEIAPGMVKVKGPKGELSQEISRDITVELDDGIIKVSRQTAVLTVPCMV